MGHKGNEIYPLNVGFERKSATMLRKVPFPQDDWFFFTGVYGQQLQIGYTESGFLRQVADNRDQIANLDFAYPIVFIGNVMEVIDNQSTSVMANCPGTEKKNYTHSQFASLRLS